MKWFAALLGFVAGYYCVVIPSCKWFWPNSNLCGILWPIGSIGGAILGYWLVARIRK